MRELFPILYAITFVAVLVIVLLLFINRNNNNMKQYFKYTFVSIGAVGKQTYNWIGNSQKKEG